MAIGRDDLGRRPDRRVGKTRKALKEALTDLILEKGYESVTVQDVIDRADVGRSTFYAHFVDKDDLLMAILADLEMPGLDPTSWKAGRSRLRLDARAVPPFRFRKAAVQGRRGRPERVTRPPRDDAATRGARRGGAVATQGNAETRRVQAPDRRPLPRRDVHRVHGLVDARGERSPARRAGRPRLSRAGPARGGERPRVGARTAEIALTLRVAFAGAEAHSSSQTPL